MIVTVNLTFTRSRAALEGCFQHLAILVGFKGGFLVGGGLATSSGTYTVQEAGLFLVAVNSRLDQIAGEYTGIIVAINDTLVTSNGLSLYVDLFNNCLHFFRFFKKI